MWTLSHFKKTILWYINRPIYKFLANYASDETYIKYKFYQNAGYFLNLKHPKNFCEKIQWLKLNMIRPDFTQMVDKATAKDFVTEIIGDKYIIPTYGIWNKLEDIIWDDLPNQFVIKSTNDSGGVVVCKDKRGLDIESAKLKLKGSGSRDYTKYNKEYPYKNVPHRFIAEALLSNNDGSELADYKFYCFSGKAEYCQVIADRHTDETIDFYDRNWIHQPFIGLTPNVHHAKSIHPIPSNYDDMLNVADRIAKRVNHPFVRVDLYNIDGSIYFGEITFFPSSGTGKITPSEWDKKLGDMITLPFEK